MVLPLSTAGVVVALVFVSSPFFMRQAEAAFGAVDRSLIEASRTLGASEARTFARVAIPWRCPVSAPGRRSPGAGRWASSARR